MALFQQQKMGMAEGIRRSYFPFRRSCYSFRRLSFHFRNQQSWLLVLGSWFLALGSWFLALIFQKKGNYSAPFIFISFWFSVRLCRTENQKEGGLFHLPPVALRLLGVIYI